ncbi:lysophospholipid acyltransferase family protein [Mycobacterium sp. 2YAF39]
MRDDPTDTTGRVARFARGWGRIALILSVLPVMPLTAIPHPRQYLCVRLYSRLLLRCSGVRIRLSGNEIGDMRGVLVVSPHISWIDVLAIWSVMPGLFVAKADMVKWPGIGLMARLLGVVPIDRTKLRPLPGIIIELTARLRLGQTVATFPEGTSWCGMAYGRFRPAMFQAAIDAARPVQPLRLSYHHADGRRSTVPAFVGEDTLTRSIWRVVATPQTIVEIHVADLQAPGTDRRELARRCQAAVCDSVEAATTVHVAA